MDGNQKQVSFVGAVRLNHRAWKLWWGICPWLFVSVACFCAVSAAGPCVSVWMTARLVEGLAEGQNPRVLVGMAAAQVIVTGVLSLAAEALGRFKCYETDSALCRYDRIFMDKMVSLDYEHMDNQAVYDRYAQIVENDRWSGLGLYQTVVLFESLSASAARILGGVCLTASMFFARVPAGRDDLAWMNHPLWGLGLLGIVIGVSGCSSLCADRGQGYWTRFAAENGLGNRLADFYMSLSRDRKRAVDLRMYGQQEGVGRVYMSRNHPLGLSSPMARYARGPMGLWLACSRACSAVLTAAVYGFVCLKAWAGAYGAGMVTQYTGAWGNLFLGISDLMNGLGRMRSNGCFLEEALDFLDIPNTMYRGSLTTEKRSDRKYEVEFRDVSFRYPGRKEYVLHHVSMKFPVGSRLAVVGMNGSGKTTFIKLLCRLYDPVEGEILLNGIDVRKYREEDYRRLFSVVFQDFQLFSLPLGENIAGGREYEPERAKECLEKAGFGDWRRVLGRGMDTWLYRDLDEAGVFVSGGEAQKIAIARALYRDAPFMVLDEPTAALDPVAEAEIYERLYDIAGDRTAVYISHRLASCKFCDRIAVFHEGEIVQTGSHEELLAVKGGMYERLWRAQAVYYGRGSGEKGELL